MNSFGNDPIEMFYMINLFSHVEFKPKDFHLWSNIKGGKICHRISNSGIDWPNTVRQRTYWPMINVKYYSLINNATLKQSDCSIQCWHWERIKIHSHTCMWEHKICCKVKCKINWNAKLIKVSKKMEIILYLLLSLSVTAFALLIYKSDMEIWNN